MLDFSKPATGTLNSYSSSSAAAVANDSKKDKKDKKEKKEKKEKKDKKTSSKDRHHNRDDDDDDNNNNDQNTAAIENGNNNNQQQQESRNLPKSSSASTTPPILSGQSSARMNNNNAGTAAGTFNSHVGTASFGFFGMQQQQQQAVGGKNLSHNNNMSSASNSSVHTTSNQNNKPSSTAVQQNSNNNRNDDDELDSDIEEVDAGAGVTAASSKNSKRKHLDGGDSSQTSSSAENATENNNNSETTKKKHHHHQQLSEAERVKLSQQAMQKQFAELGVSKAIKASSTGHGRLENSSQQPSSKNDDDDEDEESKNTVLDSLNRIDVLARMKHDDILEFVPRSLLLCNLHRQKGGFFDSNIYFQLKSEVGGHFILSARKRSFKSTTNFIISASDSSTSKSSDQFLGKVRGNTAKTQYVVYDSGDRPENGYFDEVNSLQQQQQFFGNKNNNNNDNNKSGGGGLSSQQIDALGQSIAKEAQLREELAYILFAANVGGSGGARKIMVILPKPSPDFGNPTKKYRPRDDTETMKAHWKKDPSKFLTLENKEPTWNEALRAYQLNFNGRVTEQSVKNFQLVESSNKNRVVLQVGKRGDDEFAVDFKAPLTAFMALSIALTAFDGSLTRE